jgi:D-threo-aldose 1-dehydrogenase
MSSFEDSLKRTGLDHIDLVLVHDLGKKWHGDKAELFWNQFCGSGFKALDELRRNRNVSAVGLGVNETEIVLEVAKDFKIDCALIAGQYTLLDHKNSYEDLKKLSESNVKILAAGIFNSGVLALGNTSQASYNYKKVPTEIVSKIQKIQAICLKYDVSLATAALQFAASHPAITSLVSGAKNKEETITNIQSFSKIIPYEFWVELKSENIISEQIPITALN